VDRVVGLVGVRAEIAMVQTPDGHGRLELTEFFTLRRAGPATRTRARTPLNPWDIQLRLAGEQRRVAASAPIHS
jgi:hypothetical protein